MSYLSVEFVKKNCVFILKIETPLRTMERLMDFFSERKIYVDSLQMQMIEGGEAKCMVYCLIEKDRIQHTKNSMEKMRGVVECQLLEHKENHMINK